MTKKLKLWIRGWELNEAGQKQYRLLNEGLISHKKFWREMEEIERQIEKIDREQEKLKHEKFWNEVFLGVLLIMAFLVGFLLGLWAKFNI